MDLTVNDNGLYYWENDKYLYREGKMSEDKALVANMFQKHRDEIDIAPFPETVDIDILKYIYMQSLGQVGFAGVIDKATDKVVGYSGFLLYDHPFFHAVKVGATQFFYLDPKYRKGHVGIRLMKFSEELSKVRHNCDYFTIIGNSEKDLTSLMVRLGYRLTDLVYTKQLRGN